MELEIRIKLQPKQQTFRRAIETTPIVFYGGARGGGKSKGVRDIMLMRRIQFPDTHGGLFRRTYKELEGNHIRPIFKEYPALKQYWNDSKKLLSLPNGSTLEFCHAENENDVDLYQGREFEDLAIEEAGQWTEPMFRKLLGSNRSSKSGFKPRCLLTGNPGGIGHAWLKRIFIERRFNTLERPDDYAFVPALVDDNQALILNDPDYVHKLESEPNEALRKAWRYGDWDIFAGQYFGEIRREVHFINPFPIPSHWNKFGSYDYGYNHPAAFGWFASDSDGNVFMYRELVKAQLRVDQFAHEILKFDETKDLYPLVAGHDCWTKRNTINENSPPTIAEEFAKNGLYLQRAVVDRIQGASQLRNYLAWQNLSSGREKPRLFIFNTCPITFDCLTRMQHDPLHIEDVLKVDASEGDPLTGDDPYDMIRYALMSRPRLTDEPKIIHKFGSPEADKQFARALEEHNVTRLQKEKDVKDNQVFTWEPNDKGENIWNRWD